MKMVLVRWCGAGERAGGLEEQRTRRTPSMSPSPSGAADVRDGMLTAGQHLSCVPERTRHLRHVCRGRGDGGSSGQLSSTSFHIAGGGLHQQGLVTWGNEVLLPLCNCFCCDIVLQSRRVAETSQVNGFFLWFLHLLQHSSVSSEVSQRTAAFPIHPFIQISSNVCFFPLLFAYKAWEIGFLLSLPCLRSSRLYPPGHMGAGLEK